MESARPSQQRKNAHGTRVAPCMDAEAAPSPRAPMAALESTLNAEAEDSVVVKETALTTTEDAEEDNDAVGPLEAWGETKEPEKEEKKLHQCVFDTNRKLGLHLKRGDDGRAVVTRVDEEGQAAAGRLKAGYILATFDDEACDEYDLFLECFAGAKEHQALIRLGFEKVKAPKENDEETLVEAECEVQEAIVERAPPEKRDMLARKIKLERRLHQGRGKAAAVQAKLDRITAILGAVSDGFGGEAGQPGV